MIFEHIPASHWHQNTRWRVVEPVEIDGVLIPKGFVTDGASVPRMLWWLFPPTGRYMEAALLHDYLLQEHPRYYADHQFLSSMTRLGVAKWRRQVMFYAVRIFGILKDN